MCAAAPLLAVCFDLDGVIADSEEIHFEAERRTLAARGVTFTVAEKKARYVGATVYETAHKLAERYRLGDGEVLFREREDHFFELVKSTLELRPGARELLERLKGRDVPFALVTSGNRLYVDAVFERFGIGKLFAGVVTMEDVADHKPAPDPYLAGARLLGVDPGRCAAVEDSPAGVASAKAAGLYCVAAPSEMTADADLSAADERVESLEQMDDALLDRLFGTA